MNTKFAIKLGSSLLAVGALMLPLTTVAQAGSRDNSTERVLYAKRTRTIVTTTPTRGWVTAEGVLTDDADDKNFTIRDAWGRTFRVETSRYRGAEGTNKLQKGQRVRVYGSLEDGKLYATNLRQIYGVAPGKRIRYRNVYYTIGQMNTLTGKLTTDADDDEFEFRVRTGQTYMVRTRSIPDFKGANKLQKGQRVRVYGYWTSEAGGGQPQFEAVNIRAL